MKSVYFHFLAVVLAIGAIASAAEAQTGQLRTFVPEPAFAELSYSHTGKTDLDSGGKYARYDVQYHGEMPLILDDPLRLAVFGDARWTHINLEDTPAGELNVYKGAITLDAHHAGFYPFLVHGQLSAGLYSDLKEIDGDDARARGKLLVEYPVTQVFSLLAGGAYDEVFGDDELYLIGGFRWKPTPELLLDLQYPKSRAVFAPTKGTAFTLNVGYAGDNWTILHDKQECDLRVEGFLTEVGAEFALRDSLWIRLSAGWLIERSVEIWKEDGSRLKGNADDSYVGGIALLWR